MTLTCETTLLGRVLVDVSSREVGMGVAPIKCVGGGASGRREVVTVCGGGSDEGGGEGDEGGNEIALTASTAASPTPPISMLSRS